MGQAKEIRRRTSKATRKFPISRDNSNKRKEPCERERAGAGADRRNVLRLEKEEGKTAL